MKIQADKELQGCNKNGSNNGKKGYTRKIIYLNKNSTFFLIIPAFICFFFFLIMQLFIL